MTAKPTTTTHDDADSEAGDQVDGQAYQARQKTKQGEEHSQADSEANIQVYGEADGEEGGYMGARTETCVWVFVEVDG